MFTFVVKKQFCCILWKFVDIFFNKYALFVCSTCMNVTCVIQTFCMGKGIKQERSDILFNKQNSTYINNFNIFVASLETIEILKFRSFSLTRN